MVSRGITTYQSLLDRRFATNVSATMMMKNNRLLLQKGHSTYARSSRWEADDSAQRDYDWPIHSQKAIPGDYDCDDKNDE